MAKLLIQGNSPGEILLNPGRNRVGRSPENDIQIGDPSISSFHCELYLEGPTLRITDLNSTNGSYIDSIPVREGTINSGQSLRLGNVELRWEPEESRPVPSAIIEPPRARVRISSPVASTVPPPVEPEPLAGGPEDCSRHAGTVADFICQKCGRLLCQACAKSRSAGSLKVRACPFCGGVCVSRAGHAMAQARKDLTFFGSLPSAFSYPLKGNGPFLLFGGTIFFALLNAANGILGRVGVLSLTLITLSVGYTFSYMQAIILSSLHGEDRMPPWPDLSNYYEDIVVPFFRLIAIWAI